MAVNQGKRPFSRVQGSPQHSAPTASRGRLSSRPKQTKRTGKKAAGHRELERKPKWPVCVVTREGKTTIRQFPGRRFVRFGDFRGKKVSWVEFYTWGTDYNSISVRFQDRTVVSFRIDPMFTIKPEYYRLKDGDLETVKEWPCR